MAGTTSGVLIGQNGDDVDITLFQGKTVNFTVTWGGTSPINISGYSARLQARRDYGSAIMAEFTTTNGRISLGGTSGIITISMSAADSAVLTPFEGLYDLELVSGVGAVYQVMSGKFNVLAEVTK
jgi:hypothetical protein